MTLNDTAALMKSDNYKDRFAAEYYQLAIRYKKLKAGMRVRWSSPRLAPGAPTTSRSKQWWNTLPPLKQGRLWKTSLWQMLVSKHNPVSVIIVERR